MSDSPSRIVIGIVGACLLLTLLVVFRSGNEEEESEAPAPRPGAIKSQALKPKVNNPLGRRDDGGSYASGDIDRPRNLPGSSMDPPRAGSLNADGAKPGVVAPDAKHLDVASGAGRNLAAEPKPEPVEGAGVLPAPGGPVAISPELQAAMPSAPEDASLAVPFNGNGDSLGSMAPLVNENVVYDLEEGAYFPPEARFAYGDSGSVQNGAGTIAFWMKPNWDGTDPRNASLVQFRTDDWSNRLQIFKNGIYLRYLFTDNTGNETNLTVDMEKEGWVAGDWHHVAVTWGDSLIGMYVDGQQKSQGTYLGELDVPSGTELYVGSDRPGGNPGADATLQDFFVVDRAAPTDEVAEMYNKGRSS
jgi:hypothetical protein